MPFTKESIDAFCEKKSMCEICGKYKIFTYKDNIGMCSECNHKDMLKKAKALEHRCAITPAKLYNIPEMSVQEEMNLPANMRQTLSNKINMIEKCGIMQQALDQIKFRTKNIPVIDDDKHAAGIQEMADLFMQAYDMLWKVAKHGIF